MLCILSVAASCAGCSTLPPPASAEVRQQALGDVSLDRTWAATAASAQAVQDDWLSSFQDPTLDALVREAIGRNPDLRVAAARVEQAGQYLVVAQSRLRPAIGIAGTGGTKSSGGGDTTSALQGIVLAASWELDVWGRLRYARNAAQQTYSAAQADFEFARQSLAATVAKAWFTATRSRAHV